MFYGFYFDKNMFLSPFYCGLSEKVVDILLF